MESGTGTGNAKMTATQLLMSFFSLILKNSVQLFFVPMQCAQHHPSTSFIAITFGSLKYLFKTIHFITSISKLYSPKSQLLNSIHFRSRNTDITKPTL